MALEVDDFCRVSVINWSRIARAHSFYEKKGYKYLETPWAVKQEVVTMTSPPTAVPMKIEDSDAILVGSAEQGLLSLALLREHIYPGDLKFSISPCFRTESVVGGITQLTFMKVELFAVVESSSKSMESYVGIENVLMNDAAEFMNSEGVSTVQNQTKEGKDLCCSYTGTELGSYGFRCSENQQGLVWAYGTGLAEPRFSSVLYMQKSSRDKFFNDGFYAKGFYAKKVKASDT